MKYSLFTAIVVMLFAGITLGYAEEITLVYTGESHAMLYPCNCPVQPDGGISRRATLLQQLRLKDPGLLLLDSGAVFAGGLMDEYTQNTELDMRRTSINLKALALMKYDAIAVGDDELNFGKDFFIRSLNDSGLDFISVNLSAAGCKSYVIKEVKGIKIGIIGVTSPAAAAKAGGLAIADPKESVRNAVAELKQRSVDVIILLSRLGESDDLTLVKEVAGIDVVIIGSGKGKDGPATKVGTTLFLRPTWQARRLGKTTLVIKDKKIIDYKAEEIRVSDQIAEDKQVLEFLPRCFADTNCKNKDSRGICKDPGTLNAQCEFLAPAKLAVTIITPKKCRTCLTAQTISNLKSQFPGLSVNYIYYPDKKADKFINELKFSALPVYIFDKGLEQVADFAKFKDRFIQQAGYYMLRPEFAGVGYFMDKVKTPGSLDVFISLNDPNAAVIMERLEEFNPQVHFLIGHKSGQLSAVGGKAELEEALRCACVKKRLPGYFKNYLLCRMRNIDSSWWQDCLGDFESEGIRSCAQGEEGKALLEDNIRLNEELGIYSGPTYLIDNQEIFASQEPPSKEEFRKIIKAR